MRARFLLLTAAALLTLGLCAATSEGQAYATASGPGSYAAVGGGGSIFQSDYGQRKIDGYFAYADVNPTWRYGFEGEVRFLRYNTDEQVTEDNYLVGARVAIIRKWRLMPYGKFLVGAGHINLPYGYAQGTFFAMVPGGGVDVALNDRWTLRLPDVEYQVWPNFATYGALHPYGVSAGISFRLNGISPFPKTTRSRH
jgi:opacity protein-like surface antigen